MNKSREKLRSKCLEIAEKNAETSKKFKLQGVIANDEKLQIKVKNNKPGPAQVGAISKAQKKQKEFQVSSILFYSTRKSKILRTKIFRKKYKFRKNGPRGALKGGHFRNCQHFGCS